MRLAVLLNRLQLSNSQRKALLEYVIQQGVLQGLLLLLLCACWSRGVALLLLPHAGSVLSPQKGYLMGLCIMQDSHSCSHPVCSQGWEVKRQDQNAVG